MSWDAGVNSAVPLASDSMEVRVADTAKEDLDLNVGIVWLTPGIVAGASGEVELPEE